MNSAQFTSELLALSRMLEVQASASDIRAGGEDVNFRVVCDELLAKIRDHVIQSRQGSAAKDLQVQRAQAANSPDVREFGYL